MRFRPQDGAFRDLSQHKFLMPPNGIVKASRLAVINRASDGFYHLERPVQWVTAAGVVYNMLLIPVVLPTGASDITLGTMAWSGSTRVYTPTKEGHLLYNTGALVPTASAPQLAENVEGVLFTEYFSSGPSNETYNDKLIGYELTLEEGDLFYVIREMDNCEVYASETITDELAMVSSGAAAGQVADAATFDTGGTVAAYSASLRQNITGDIAVYALGRFKTGRTGAGLVTANLRLPRWRGRTTQ